MSWNPFKKKSQDQETVSTNATETQTDPSPVIDNDDTDPMVMMETFSENEEVIRQGEGIELVSIELNSNGSVTDQFLKLKVKEHGPLADAISRLVVTVNESACGFRDLLAGKDSALSVSITKPSAMVSGLVESKLVINDQLVYLRPIELINSLKSLAQLFNQLSQSGFHWKSANISGLGLIDLKSSPYEPPKNHIAFFAWDELTGIESDPLELIKCFIEITRAIRDKASTRGFSYGLKSADALIGWLTDLADEDELAYSKLAELIDNFSWQTDHLGQTDPGVKRKHNEDAFMLIDLDQESSVGAEFKLAVVADGMGGHQSGEIASSLGLDLIRQQLMMTMMAPSSTTRDVSKLKGHLENIIPGINRALIERAQLDAQLSGMGTTLVGYASIRQQSTMGAQDTGFRSGGALFHVGDSRAYLIGPYYLKRITCDHSFVQDLVLSGTITEDEAFDHPRKNVITRCLGGGNSDSTPDIQDFILGPGEILLLASDGLSDALRFSQIEGIILKWDGTSLEKLTSSLIGAANQAGGPDNITVLLIRSGC